MADMHFYTPQVDIATIQYLLSLSLRKYILLGVWLKVQCLTGNKFTSFSPRHTCSPSKLYIANIETNQLTNENMSIDW
jgi:hypothetical protein